jgi:S1-C subfamily serine protease
MIDMAEHRVEAPPPPPEPGESFGSGRPPPRPRRLRATTFLVFLVLLLSAGTFGTTTILLWGDVNGLRERVAETEDLGDRVRSAEADAEDLRGRVETLEGGSFDTAAIVEGVAPSVFTILAPVGRGPTALGSGFVLAKEESRSLLVTNFHVVQERWAGGARDVVVERGNRVYEGEIVRVNPLEDLALVAVVADLPVLESTVTPAEIGAPVVVVGSGWGFDGTVTTGVVSAVDRPVEGERWLQVSAAINPGNSGGPIVDDRGLVIGVATWKIADVTVEGLGFAIPVERVCPALDVC